MLIVSNFVSAMRKFFSEELEEAAPYKLYFSVYGTSTLLPFWFPQTILNRIHPHTVYGTTLTGPHIDPTSIEIVQQNMGHVLDDFFYITIDNSALINPYPLLCRIL